MQEKESKINSKENELREQENMVDTREKTMQEKESKINSKENEIRERENMVDTREKTLQHRETEMINKENEIQDRKMVLGSKEKDTPEKRKGSQSPKTIAKHVQSSRKVPMPKAKRDGIEVERAEIHGKESGEHPHYKEESIREKQREDFDKITNEKYSTKILQTKSVELEASYTKNSLANNSELSQMVSLKEIKAYEDAIEENAYLRNLVEQRDKQIGNLVSIIKEMNLKEPYQPEQSPPIKMKFNQPRERLSSTEIVLPASLQYESLVVVDSIKDNVLKDAKNNEKEIEWSPTSSVSHNSNSLLESLSVGVGNDFHDEVIPSSSKMDMLMGKKNVKSNATASSDQFGNQKENVGSNDPIKEGRNT